MRVASSALLTRKVVSRNHSSGSAADGGCSSRTWTTHSARLVAGAGPAPARSVTSAIRPAVLAPAFTRALSRCDLGGASGGAFVSNRRRETVCPSRLFPAEDAGLGADQQVDLRGSRAFDEQVEEVGLAHAHHAGLGQARLPARSRAAPRSNGTTCASRAASGRSPSASELGDAGASPNASGIDGQGRVQLQAARHRPGLVRADGSPCVCPRRQAGAVDAQHRVVRRRSSRCGARMLPTVTALSAGWSISR